MKVIIEITEQEIKDLKLIRNYFGEHDVTMLEHFAYSELDKLVKKLTIPAVVKSLPNDDEIEQAANKEATRIFDGTGSGSEWYARHHGFTDGVEWLKNHLAK